MTLYDALDEFGSNVVDSARDKLANTKYPHANGQSYTKNNTGYLSRNLRYQVQDDGGSLVVTWFAPDYHFIVDQGRLKGTGVPIQPLVAWINQRKLTLKPNQTAEDLASLLSYIIKNRGIRPTFFFTKSFDENEINFNDALQDFTSMPQDIEDVLDQLDAELGIKQKGSNKKLF